LERDFYYRTFLKANGKKKAEMECFKRVRNSKTGVVRGILKCLVPCMRRRKRSPTPESSSNTQENKTLKNCKDTTRRVIGDQYKALIRAEREHELIDIQKMTRDEETFWTLKWTKESPHSEYFDGLTFEETE